MTPLLGYSSSELETWLTQRGAPKFRDRQIRQWLFDQRVTRFEEMSNLPKALRSALAAEFEVTSGLVVERKGAEDGTEKLLIEWSDRRRVECVLIREGGRRTVCLSTQVGCAMGCVFCASGLDGVERNLTTAEILEQMVHLARLLPTDERLSNIVVMGMGEPLANLKGVLPALAVAASPDGFGISPRRITISTVGIPQAIDRLTEADSPYHLAVSLHAPNDELRNRLVPVNAGTGLEAILAAADRYFAGNKRRLTFEYVLLGELNDRPEHARELATRLRGRTALLNVIPYNPVAGLPYRTPEAGALGEFLAILDKAGINVQVRQRKGDRIDAACGQLRRSKAAVEAQPVDVATVSSFGDPTESLP